MAGELTAVGEEGGEADGRLRIGQELRPLALVARAEDLGGVETFARARTGPVARMT